MMNQPVRAIRAAAALATVFAGLTGGCTGELLDNLIEEQTGDIAVVLINNTPHRAVFTLGAYDAWVRSPRVAPELSQQRLERMTSTAVVIPCKRNTAIGTDALVEQIIRTETDLTPDFDADAFSAVVNFSSAAVDSTAAALPTEGTAEGIEVLLGVDYACGDQLIFTFEEDATATGGFRIDYTLLHAEEDE